MSVVVVVDGCRNFFIFLLPRLWEQISPLSRSWGSGLGLFSSAHG